MTCVVWDLDGTLLLADRSIDYSSPADVREACEPCPQLCHLARRQVDAGLEVHIVTGRTPVLDEVTAHQLDGAQVWNGWNRVHLQPEWAGFVAMARWKATVLEDLGAAVYVGDHMADQVAAEMAGCRFVHADTLRLLAGPSSSASPHRRD